MTPQNDSGNIVLIRQLFSLIRTLPSANDFHIINRICGSWAVTTGLEFHRCTVDASPENNRYSILRVIFVAITYSAISATTPEPTVLPPSRIAKRSPFSIAIGVISSTFISTLSPGRHISTPSGRSMIPVTSVVLK